MSTHLCHAHGCYTPIAPKLFMCKHHWFSLPRAVRAAVWREYRPGQEIDKNPSPRYMAVQKLAVARTASDAFVAAQYLVDAHKWGAVAIQSGQGDPLVGLWPS